MTTPKTITLQHPVNHTEATATVLGFWYRHGRAVGQELLFSDGYRIKLLYDEIRTLQAPQPADGPVTTFARSLEW